MKNSHVEDLNVTSTARGHFRMNHTFTILQYSFQTPRNQITKVGSHKHSQQQIEPSQKRFKKSIFEDLHFTYLQPTEVFSNKFFMMYSASGHNSQWNHTCMSDSLLTSIQQQVKRVYETTCVCLIHCWQVFSRRSKQSMKPQVYVWFTVDKYSADSQSSVWNHRCMSDSLSTSIQQTVTKVSQTTRVCLIHCRQVFRDVYSFNTMYGVELSSRSTVQ